MKPCDLWTERENVKEMSGEDFWLGEIFVLWLLPCNFILCYSNMKHFWSIFMLEKKSKRTRRKVEEKSKECRRFFGPRKMACRFLEKIHTHFRETCEVWQWRPARFLWLFFEIPVEGKSEVSRRKVIGRSLLICQQERRNQNRRSKRKSTRKFQWLSKLSPLVLFMKGVKV